MPWRTRLRNCGLKRRQLVARRRLGEQQIGLHRIATVGDARGHDGELQRRRRHVALADAEIEGITLLPGDVVLLLLPGAGRQVAARFARQAEFAGMAEPELGGCLGDLVDARPPRRLIEEAVA
jgi:hypothetical protein